MKSDRDKEFEQSMIQLVHLLKKLVKNMPSKGGFPSKDSGINMNIFMMSFLPISPDDFEELEDLYDQYLGQDSEFGPKFDDLNMELNSSDLQFLNEHGIQF